MSGEDNRKLSASEILDGLRAGQQRKTNESTGRGYRNDDQRIGGASGHGFSPQGSGGMGPEQLALLLKNGGGDPSVSAYIHDMLAQWASPFNYNASLKASRFNPPAAMPGNPVGGTAHGQRTLGFTNGTNIDLGARKQRYEQGYQDKRGSANRQNTLDQDYRQAERMQNMKLALAQHILGQYGRSNLLKSTSTHNYSQLFNNAGGPQVIPMSETTTTQNSFSPQDILSLLNS